MCPNQRCLRLCRKSHSRPPPDFEQTVVGFTDLLYVWQETTRSAEEILKEQIRKADVH